MSTGTAALPWPEVPSFAVERPALVDRLDNALDHRIVLLVAPAGYGKSVLLGQWAAANPAQQVAWISARDIGGEALHFGRRLRDALAAAEPDLDNRLGRLPGTTERLGPVLIDHVIEELERGPDLVVVIEDFEHVASTAVLGEVGQLAVRLPPNVHLVLASRRDPDIGLHRLRLQDQVDEIRQGDLAMSEDEARQIVRALAGCELRADQARAIVERTEGWPAGLQLAALSLRDRDDVDRYLEEFSGDDRHVADYLSDEILEGLDADEREFLLVTSVLNRLSGPLCNALTGRSDGQRMLESLHQRSLFLSASDTRRAWYRYHALFRDLLRYELRTERPADELPLHRRAAEWLLAADDSKGAAEHLLAAGDWEAVIALADHEGRAYFERGESHVPLSWLERLPRELVDRRPEVALSTVVLRMTSGQALAAEDLAERTAQAHDLPPALRGVVELARVTLVYHHGRPHDVLAAAARILDLVPQMVEQPDPILFGITDADSLRIQAQAQAARAELLLGHIGTARTWIAQALEGTTYAPWAVHVLGTSAYCDALSGRLTRAAEGAHRALVVAGDTGLLQHPAVADAHLALAHVAIRRGEPEGIAAHLDEALVAARMNRRHLLVSLHRAEWAEWLLASERADGLALVSGEHAVGEPPRAAGVQARVTATQARLLLAAGRAERATGLLEDHAELVTPDLAAARATVAAASGDVALLRKVVDDWPVVDRDEPWSVLQRHLWEVVLLDGDERRADADTALDDLLAAAEPDGHIQLFREGGRDIARILRRRYLSRPSPYLRRVVEAVADGPASAHSDDLVEQLSERELEVLRYLPSRLSNAEIAGRLFVSVNTLKTHLKAIYRKLGVTSRSAAVDRAEELDLA